jgi:hypothetical protein
VPVLAPGAGKTKTGRLWAYLRDERPYAGTAAPAVFYRYSPDRRAEHPRAHLAGFRGVLHADGYAGFEGLYDAGRVMEAACWAHVRRKFFDMHAAGKSPVASEALARIQALYAIEEDVRGRLPDHRRRARQTRAGPLVADMRAWLDAMLRSSSKRSDLAAAIRYALGRWPALMRYIDDGTVEIDNNPVERAIRPIPMRVSLCSPFSSVCKHWKCISVGRATRATLSGDRSFDRFRRQVIGTDLVRRSGDNLHSRKNAGFNEAPYRVVCNA